MAVLRCTLTAVILGWSHDLRADALYSITDLGSLGGNSTMGYGINNLGQVVGGSLTAVSVLHAFMYSDGQMRDLGVLPGNIRSQATAINDAGQVIGSLATSILGFSGGFLYSNGQMNDLGIGFGIPASINNAGQIAGTYFVSGSSHGFLYSNGRITDITLGTVGTQLSGINNSGQVTGSSALLPGGPYYHAFLYSNGQIKDLDAGGYSFGIAINDSGQVTGQSVLSTGTHSFLYSEGRMIDLGTLGTGNTNTYGIGRAINNSGKIVGTASSGSALGGPNQAFIYTDGHMINLNELIEPNLGITLTDATAINDESQIVANGLRGQSYLLTPTSNVPEPSTWALLGIPSLLLLGWSNYRSRISGCVGTRHRSFM